jgi:hypothetical protein
MLRAVIEMGCVDWVLASEMIWPHPCQPDDRLQIIHRYGRSPVNDDFLAKRRVEPEIIFKIAALDRETAAQPLPRNLLCKGKCLEIARNAVSGGMMSQRRDSLARRVSMLCSAQPLKAPVMWSFPAVWRLPLQTNSVCRREGWWRYRGEPQEINTPPDIG